MIYPKETRSRAVWPYSIAASAADYFRRKVFPERSVLGEVISWLAVLIAAVVAWVLYAFGEDAPRRKHAKDRKKTE